MSVETFDLSRKMKDRLQETNAEKQRTQAQINAVTEQLQRMIRTVPKKPRESLETMDTIIRDLESRRTKASLPLSEEKAILKQIDGIKRAKRQLGEYNRHQTEIKEKKTELDALRASLRLTAEAISELDSALSKVELAKRLSCAPSDLKSIIIDCPQDKLGRVIGKNGSNIRQIEERTGVQISLADCKIHLCGSDEALQKASREVEKVTLAVEEKMSVSKATASYLLSSRRLGLLDKLRTKHGIFIDLEQDGETLRIRGLSGNVASAIEEISNMQCTTLTKELSTREASLVVGKGGSVINALTDKHSVVVNITKPEGVGPSILEIDGPSHATQAAFDEIETMIYEHEDVSESVAVQAMQRQKLLSNSGKGVQAVQAEINKEMGLPKNTVRLSFEKSPSPSSSSESSASSAQSKLLVKTKREYISKAKDLVQQRIDAYDEDCVTLSVPQHLISQIIGRGGETINMLRNEGTGGEVEVDKATGAIHIHADDASTRKKIVAAVEDIVAKNQTIEIPVEKVMIGAIFGASGKEMLKTVVSTGAYLKMNKADTHIVLRGTTEQVHECASLLNYFIESNYVEDFTIPANEQSFLFQGGDDSVVKQLEKDHTVTTVYRKGTNQLYVRGEKGNVEAAMQRVKQVFVGGGGFAVCKLQIPDGVVGSIVGKGGKNLKSLESENPGVVVQIDKDSTGLSIRGPEELVARVRSSIVATMSSARVVDTVLISEAQHETLKASSMTRNIASTTNTQLTLTVGEVRIRGIRSDVLEAKSLVEEILSGGKYKSYIQLDEAQVVLVRAAIEDPSHFDRIKTSTNTEVILDESASFICITGKRSNVRKAKGLLLGFLDFILPSQLERIKVSRPLIKSVCDPECLAKIGADSGASVILDRDLSSVVVRSSNPEIVRKATELVHVRVAECERLNHVHKFCHSEAWIVPKLIGKGGSSIQNLERDSGCVIEVSKEDLTVVIRGDDESKVESGRAMLVEAIDMAKKECIFIDFPEAAMPAFIGKAGSHINTLREHHNVSIDRLRKERTRMQIQGLEANVSSAKAAIDEWLKEWEAQHVGETIAVEQDFIPAVIGNKGSVVNAIEKDLKVRIGINSSTGIVTITGGTKEMREEAKKKIKEIECQQQTVAAEKEEARKLKAAEDAAERVETMAAAKAKASAQRSAAVADGEVKVHPQESVGEKNDRSNEFASVPVGMTITAEGKQEANDSQAKKEAEPLQAEGGTETARTLFSMLIADSNEVPTNVLTDEQWESSTSTVSSAAASSDSQESFEGGGEGGYFKSTSGFSVRL
mmetsp:Transcript_24816/g.54113  ORF Transcript_24816/g.54113 Transcript_24816/m.54113 type:complete len:1287 (+) Transcript_24816:129-3989(+)